MYKKLKQKIENKTVKICIVGLGYVGLPLVREFLKKNLNIIGYDIDQKKINSLKSGISYIKNIPHSEVKNFLKKKFHASSDKRFIKIADVVIYCLPTPLNKNKGPDMSYIENTLNENKKNFRKGQLHILESTTYPGTTEEYYLPIFKKLNLTVGKNIFLGYSPEREDPGNDVYSIGQISKVVSGYTVNCKNLVKKVYDHIVKKTISVSNIKSAEMTKLLENIYRCVNIGMINELKLVCEKMSIDIFEIINAAKTKPFGFQPFYPGPGLGGHCIPIDPYILSWKAKEFGIDTKFIELAGQINDSMPEYVIKNLNSALNATNKTLKNSKILILGAAYKKNVDDIRESPALKIIEILKFKKAKVFYHDPFIKKIENSRKYNFKMKSVKITHKSIKIYDAVIIVADHDVFDYDLIKKNSNLIIDTRGRYKLGSKRVIRS
jgi:UDP-N-acetyl-D-glucosamine dehydrogenase